MPHTVSLVSLLLAAAVAASPSSFYGPEHNGGFYPAEQARAPAAGKKPHIMFILFDDYGWANLGAHRNPPTPEIQTPNLDSLIDQGILLDRAYVYKFCSPTRSAIQSGRNPIHVNNLNLDPTVHNPADPVSGFAAIPRNMTGIATKLSSAGYKTFMAGKWDAGMATVDHTPHGRGYQNSMFYFHHANDYWTEHAGGCKDIKGGVVDLWNGNGTAQKPAHGFNGTCVGENATGAGCRPGPLGDHVYNGFEDAMFAEHVRAAIETHDPSDPLFVFWAPHIVHAPLQVPPEYFEKFGFIAATDKPGPGHPRQTYHAMVNFADMLVGTVVDTFKKKGMFDDLLIVFSSDNGGPVYASGSAGANNYPLRGGKMSNNEGGVRVNSFASGGFLPEQVRGTKHEGYVTGWDWYATFCDLAGVDPTDHRAAAAGLPPIDSLSQVDVIMGKNMTSPRTEIPLGTPWVVTKQFPNTTVNGLIMGDYKILVGTIHEAGWQGPHYPNTSTVNVHCFDSSPQGTCNIVCEPACLYNIVEDPTEHTDLAAQMPDKVDAMLARLKVYIDGAFRPNRGKDDPAACDLAATRYGGFWGPFVFP